MVRIQRIESRRMPGRSEAGLGRCEEGKDREEKDDAVILKREANIEICELGRNRDTIEKLPTFITVLRRGMIPIVSSLSGL